MGDTAGGVFFVSGICTIFTYVIGVSITWGFSKGLYETPVSITAAVVITLPVFAVIGAFIAGKCCCNKVFEAAWGCSMLLIAISAILDIVGVILLIVSMVKASKDLDDPAGPIVCGTFAALFVFASALCNCITVYSLKHFSQKTDTSEPKD